MLFNDPKYYIGDECHKRSYGYANIALMTGLTLIGFMVFSLAIDTAKTLTVQNNLQTAAEASAMAGIQEFWLSDASSSDAKQEDAKEMAQDLSDANLPKDINFIADDVEFGYVDPDTKTANEDFDLPHPTKYMATGGYNAIKVIVIRDEEHSAGAVPTWFGSMFGKNKIDTQANALAMLSVQIGKITSGLRPIYGCQAQYDAVKQYVDQGLSSPKVRIYGDSYYIYTGLGSPLASAEKSGNVYISSISGFSMDKTLSSFMQNKSELGFLGTYALGAAGGNGNGNGNGGGNNSGSGSSNDNGNSGNSSDQLEGWTLVAGCPEPGSGNWGFADLRDCSSGSVGASTVGDWFANGYNGTVEVGKCYSTKPGNFIASGPVSNALDQLIANQTKIMIPVVPENGFNGSGSNTQVYPSSFVGFVITDYKATGNQESRYIEGYYTKMTCKGQCHISGSAGEGSIAKIEMIGVETN
jgi:hypothetical protein